MVNYRRSRIAGGTYFFTVNLRDRKRGLLIEHIDVFWQIVRKVKRESPFIIDAMVALPDHWRPIWTLAPDDSNYAGRIRLIKARFTKHLMREGVTHEKDLRGEYRLPQKRYWEHTIRDDLDF